MNSKFLTPEEREIVQDFFDTGKTNADLVALKQKKGIELK
jgi:hypothetical protein